MDNKYSSLISEFESNLRNLISNYNALKAENSQLKRNLELKNEEIMHAHKEILDLRNDYLNLETAASLSGSLEKSDKVKQHINKLVREIDKCLMLLNE
ncbi:MAG: hypothetical protein QM751_01915 [Paludibacteraceae bacterium]